VSERVRRWITEPELQFPSVNEVKASLVPKIDRKATELPSGIARQTEGQRGNLQSMSKVVALACIAVLICGCNFPTAGATPPIDLVATAVAGTLAAEAPPTASPIPDLLPHPVYFLGESSGSAQVWRLERDGSAQSQITNEALAVDSFDVSRFDGSVAYVSNNQLYLVNADGSNRRLLVDNAAANPEAEDYFLVQRISDPLFSPSGTYLIYAFNGLWLLDLTSNQAVQLLENEIEESDGNVVPVAIYTPIQWAPDSQKLLVAIGGFETSGVSILNFDEGQTLTDLDTGSDVFCCQLAWGQDSSSALAASPYIGLIEPGLWRYDSENGEQTELLGVTDEGMFQFAGWPMEAADGSLRYFYTSSTEIPTSDLPLFMMRSDADGVSARVQMRPDSFSNIGEVLWADDGSLALIVQLSTAGDPNGSVILAFSDERQLQILIPSGHSLHWGF
jgi:Tol biopolymer transport system component